MSAREKSSHGIYEPECRMSIHAAYEAVLTVDKGMIGRKGICRS
jgi:hypothetical protein